MLSGDDLSLSFLSSASPSSAVPNFSEYWSEQSCFLNVVFALTPIAPGYLFL
jgi:hypothetical protein